MIEKPGPDLIEPKRSPLGDVEMRIRASLSISQRSFFGLGFDGAEDDADFPQAGKSVAPDLAVAVAVTSIKS